MKHLSVRVAWHDNKWNGTVCCKPNSNGYCTQLPRIYEDKKDDEPAGKPFWEINPTDLPPCKAEGGAFMNTRQYSRSFKHPYKEYSKANHSHLERTEFTIPDYSFFAVPFWWMLNKNQDYINSEYPGLPFNQWPKLFKSPWVYDEQRQHAILNLFFEPIAKESSLVMFYTKTGNPIDEECRRLLVGIGLVKDKSEIQHYEKSGPGPDYPLWDRLISHSIRPNGHEGFLIPYHEYLELENKQYKVDGVLKTKEELIQEIKVSLIETGDSESRVDEFSYGSEWISDRSTLSVIAKLRNTIEIIIRHGLIDGPWKERLNWLNTQVGRIKKNMGPFPSFSSALVAFGFKYGYMFSMDIYHSGLCEAKGNPWDIFEDAINGAYKELNDKLYSKDFNEVSILWDSLSSNDKKLLKLLSRFEMNAEQIKRWFDEAKRKQNGYNVSTVELLANPYLIVEEDNPKLSETAIGIETIDAGAFEDRLIQGDYLPENSYRIDSKLDKRRIRALTISVLKDAASDGDTLLSLAEIKETIEKLSINDEVEVPANYIETHIEYFKEKLSHINTEKVNALQLKKYDEIESFLSKKFIDRAAKILPSLDEDWKELIKGVIKKSNGVFDDNNVRHIDALADQSNALEILTTRKLSVLNGPAGTGKTSVMGALVASEKLKQKGILLLAPTGKARVRLEKLTGHPAYTIAQLLTRNKRFDWSRMLPLFYGKESYSAEKTVIVDECSMITEDDFYALFKLLDLIHVERIILVGDPYQLPPIGAGRPFADLCAYLEELPDESDEKTKLASKALAKLEVVVRTSSGQDSDALMLASWFAGRKGRKNSDQVFEKIGNNGQLNDIQVEKWENEDELPKVIKKVIDNVFGIDETDKVSGFDKALGLTGKGFSVYAPHVLEQFQLLSPVKSPTWGTNNINRTVQQAYRERPTEVWQRTFGDQQIWSGDKVIQIRNEKRLGYNYSKKVEEDVQLSNGQIGYLFNVNANTYAQIGFNGLEGYSVSYTSADFSENGTKIELAYAITIHKSQGSDFNVVILVLPKNGMILSRELFYTGLTRAKDKLILLVEGDDISWLFNYSKAEASVTAKRNTHLFKSEIRENRSSVPYVQNLIHKTKNGIYVRSKSEVIIGNLLIDSGIDFLYERKLETENGWRLPDFTIPTSDDELIIIEHLGMLHKPSYKEEWLQKKKFYEINGFEDGKNLFTTTEDSDGAIDSEFIQREIINKVKSLI